MRLICSLFACSFLLVALSKQDYCYRQQCCFPIERKFGTIRALIAWDGDCCNTKFCFLCLPNRFAPFGLWGLYMKYWWTVSDIVSFCLLLENDKKLNRCFIVSFKGNDSLKLSLHVHYCRKCVHKWHSRELMWHNVDCVTSSGNYCIEKTGTSRILSAA